MLEKNKLETYLAGHIDNFTGPILDIDKFTNGQSNPTYLLSTSKQKYVLRSKPPGELLKSAHAVDREFRVQKALAKTNVPVAPLHLLCEDETIMGSMFYVMDFLEGRIFWDPALPDLSKEERAKVYDEMNKVLVAIHNVDIKAVGLDTYGRPEGYFARQLKRWKGQYEASETEVILEMNKLIAWLEDYLPEEDGQVCLVHGDYRIDNIMFHAQRIEAIAVFDWELSTLGHPFADLAYQIMQRQMGRDWHIRGLAGLDTNALGIPSEEAYVKAYCNRRGIQVPEEWNYYVAFSFFRFSAICQGVKKRALQGNASSGDAMRVGAMARPLAELGWKATLGR